MVQGSPPPPGPVGRRQLPLWAARPGRGEVSFRRPSQKRVPHCFSVLLPWAALNKAKVCTQQMVHWFAIKKWKISHGIIMSKKMFVCLTFMRCWWHYHSEVVWSLHDPSEGRFCLVRCVVVDWEIFCCWPGEWFHVYRLRNHILIFGPINMHSFLTDKWCIITSCMADLELHVMSVFFFLFLPFSLFF